MLLLSSNSESSDHSIKKKIIFLSFIVNQLQNKHVIKGTGL